MKKTIAVLALSTCLAVGVAAPAWAKDSGWGCGGACRVASR